LFIKFFHSFVNTLAGRHIAIKLICMHTFYSMDTSWILNKTS